MIAFRNTYDGRKQEIDDFIELMCFLEKKENIKNDDDVSEFSKFFYQGNERITMTYQAMINILKSNVSLMIYNIIEFTVSNLMDSIYDEIKINELSYIDVNDSIRALWRKTILKSTNDPNANFNTFLKKNEEIIDYIINKTTIEIHSRNAMPVGNLDGKSIKDTFQLHGIRLETDSRNYRPDILETIKQRRNDLAHGSVSFVDAVREDSILDIKNNKTFVLNFLEELINIVNQYIENEEYKGDKSSMAI